MRPRGTGGPVRGHGTLLAVEVRAVPAQYGRGEQRLQRGLVERHLRAGRPAGDEAARVRTPTAGGPTAALLFTHVRVLFLSDLACTRSA
ncbi:hypothetical protein [Streptomyces sp. AC550_RSS872]|uniref:hypothetical protein n=1 Tax=Streptomyces sp. AC550_RSS872 TaxID=2823689 RepID=UPI0035ABABC0